MANDSHYGLTASVVTHEIDGAHRLRKAVRPGTVAVNCYSEGGIATVFRGYRVAPDH